MESIHRDLALSWVIWEAWQKDRRERVQELKPLTWEMAEGGGQGQGSLGKHRSLWVGFEGDTHLGQSAPAFSTLLSSLRSAILPTSPYEGLHTL